MKVKEKLMMDFEGLCENGPVNIVLFGDSISHGAVGNDIDYEKVYWNLLRQKLNRFRNYIPVNMINASIGGTSARESLPRLQKFALIHNPDLMIVCFGLNDVNGELEPYLDALKEIFEKSLASGAQVIFMTPNMLNTGVAEDTPADLVAYARVTAEIQNSGRMDAFMKAAVTLANSMGVTVCDCYSKWKKLAKKQDITLLLGNRINHPNAEMQHLFADSLYETIMGNEAKSEKPQDSTMYRKA